MNKAELSLMPDDRIRVFIYVSKEGSSVTWVGYVITEFKELVEILKSHE